MIYFHDNAKSRIIEYLKPSGCFPRQSMICNWLFILIATAASAQLSAMVASSSAIKAENGDDNTNTTPRITLPGASGSTAEAECHRFHPTLKTVIECCGFGTFSSVLTRHLVCQIPEHQACSQQRSCFGRREASCWPTSSATFHPCPQPGDDGDNG